MSFTDVETPKYYPEEYGRTLYYQNEYNYGEPTFKSRAPVQHNDQVQRNPILSTINYLNERKCPIYIHQIRNDDSVYNNYGQNLTTSKKNVSRVSSHNASKLVLDKLEETYWATWKPKKDNLLVKRRSPRRLPDVRHLDNKTNVHNKVPKKPSTKSHGDVNDQNQDVIKYFKANDFHLISTSASTTQDEQNQAQITSNISSDIQNDSSTASVLTDSTISSKNPFKRPQKLGRLAQTNSVSQEIQTEEHCPVILEDSNENSEDSSKHEISEKEQVSEKNDEANEEIVEKKDEPEGKTSKIRKQERKVKQGKKIKKVVKDKTKKLDIKDIFIAAETTPNGSNICITHKDSIEITKEKLEKSPRERYQQPKCIRLYRKSGNLSGHIKGGTYPLKSCLKKDTFPKGNFRLGPPGSPLFLTTNSFANSRRKLL